MHPFKGVQKSMLKAWNFTKKKSATDASIIICKNFFVNKDS